MEAKEIIYELRNYLVEHRTAPEIVHYLKLCHIDINTRKWQDIVLEYNSKYGDHESYIAGNSKGYILTYDKDKIKQANFQKINKAVSMLRNAKRDLEELGLKNQLSVIDTKCDEIEKLVDQVELLDKHEQISLGVV